MNKLLIFSVCLSLVACTAHENEESSYEIFEEPQTINSTSYMYSTKQSSHNASSVDSLFEATYMEKQTEKLQKILSKSEGSITQDGSSILIMLPHQIVFGTNQTTLEPQFESTLSAIARVFKEYDRTKIKIVGYTDNVGSVVSNRALSLRRANAVSNFLRLNGVDINRIVVDGLGQENPFASNKTAQGRAKNHRIEITLTNIQ